MMITYILIIAHIKTDKIRNLIHSLSATNHLHHKDCHFNFQAKESLMKTALHSTVSMSLLGKEFYQASRL